MVRHFIIALMLALCATGCGPDRYSDCHQIKDADRSIRACTQIIERGSREGPKTKSIAFNSRGISYAKKGKYDWAIADFDKAIELDPSLQK